MNTINGNNRNQTTLQGLLTMARDALIAQQGAISVMGNNVANANTPGYSRQRADLSTGISLYGNPGQFGTGVTLDTIRRVSDRFNNERLRQENGAFARWDNQRQDLIQVEEIFAELSDYGLSNVLDQFWIAWEDLSIDPDGVNSRVNVVSKGQQLATTFHDVASGLLGLQEEKNLQIRSQVGQINTLAQHLADLNGRIVVAQSRGQNPNDLLDERDRYLNELTSLVGGSVQIQEDGSIDFYVGGDILVQGDRVREVTWEEDASKGKSGLNLLWEDNGKMFQVDDGELYSAQYVRDEVIAVALSDLDTLANTIRDQVNSLHVQGIGKDGTTGNVFWRSDSTGALDLAVDSVILESPEKIAASRVSPTGANELAHEMYELQNQTVMMGDSYTIGEYYRRTVSFVGNESQAADTRLAASNAALQQAETWRENSSGVSLDEEMSNMILLQRSYSAVTRVISKTDDLIKTLLSLA